MSYEQLYNGIIRKPYAHQREAVEFAKGKNNVLLFWEMGTGKTGGAILLARSKYTDHGRLLRTLIVTPPVTITNWKNEFRLWSQIDPSQVHCMVQATGAKKAEYMYNKVIPQTSGAVVITNYEALLTEQFYLAIERWAPELIIFDEVHYVKTAKAKRSKLCQRLVTKSLNNFSLTGTPILKDVRDVFGIFRTADNGETFGKNEQLFAFRYLVDENAGWAGKAGYFPKWKNNPATFGELNQKIYTKSLRKLKSECLDLPPLVKIQRFVGMSPDQMKAYKNMERDYMLYLEASDSTVTANIAVVKALRLLQICTGFVGTDLGEDHVFEKNPRLEICEEYLEELTPNHKVIVWCSFRQNYRMMEKVCKKLGVDYVMLTGEQDSREKGEAVDRFQNDPKCRVIIANRASGGVGVNLTAASYSIVYSRNFSLAEELQSEARNHRGGSEIHDQIVKIDLCTQDTIEVGVLESLMNKQEGAEAVLDRIRGSNVRG